MEIATCECVAGMPLQEQWTQIYNLFYLLADASTDLPTPECVSGFTLNDKMAKVFCAASIWGTE
jgi:hypothetical protein